jgi:hypothetical protein
MENFFLSIYYRLLISMSAGLLDRKLAKVWGDIYDGEKEKRGGLLIGGVMVQGRRGGVLLAGGRKRKAAPKRRVVRSKTAAAKTNPWIKYVKAFAKAKGISYGDALKRAGPSYRARR